MASTPDKVLEALAYLLGFQSSGNGAAGTEMTSSNGRNWSSIPWENSRCHGNQNEYHSPNDPPDVEKEGEAEAEEDDCDFSSFPSFSLKKKPGADASNETFFCHREGVVAHVASLLSRPVLVGNDPAKHCSDGKGEEDDDDEISEFMEDRIENVPKVMHQNLVQSFTILIQSRLRAYATFLARHGLSLAKISESARELDEGVVGIEQKLERLLEIGSLLSLGSVRTSFVARPENAQITLDGEDVRSCMPISMEASIDVLIPTTENHSESLTLVIRTDGNITGVFSQSSQTPLLRVAQVDLDMPNLLKAMKKEAAYTVGRVIDVTNATYSVPLPHVVSANFRDGEEAYVGNASGLQETQLSRDDNTGTNKRPHFITTPDLGSVPTSSHPSDLDLVQDGEDDKDVDSLTPDKCSKIVDCLFDKIDVRCLSPPSKRTKISDMTNA